METLSLSRSHAASQRNPYSSESCRHDVAAGRRCTAIKNETDVSSYTSSLRSVVASLDFWTESFGELASVSVISKVSSPSPNVSRLYVAGLALLHLPLMPSSILILTSFWLPPLYNRVPPPPATWPEYITRRPRLHATSLHIPLGFTSPAFQHARRKSRCFTAFVAAALTSPSSLRTERRRAMRVSRCWSLKVGIIEDRAKSTQGMSCSSHSQAFY